MGCGTANTKEDVIGPPPVLYGGNLLESAVNSGATLAMGFTEELTIDGVWFGTQYFLDHIWNDEFWSSINSQNSVGDAACDATGRILLTVAHYWGWDSADYRGADPYDTTLTSATIK